MTSTRSARPRSARFRSATGQAAAAPAIKSMGLHHADDAHGGQDRSARDETDPGRQQESNMSSWSSSSTGSPMVSVAKHRTRCVVRFRGCLTRWASTRSNWPGLPRTRGGYPEECATPCAALSEAGEYGTGIMLEIMPWSNVRTVKTARDIVETVEIARSVVEGAAQSLTADPGRHLAFCHWRHRLQRSHSDPDPVYCRSRAR